MTRSGPCAKVEFLRFCITDSRGFDGEDIAPQEDMKNLRYLSLGGHRVSLDAMRLIGRLLGIEELSLGAPVTDCGTIIIVMGVSRHASLC